MTQWPCYHIWTSWATSQTAKSWSQEAVPPAANLALRIDQIFHNFPFDTLGTNSWQTQIRFQRLDKHNCTDHQGQKPSHDCPSTLVCISTQTCNIPASLKCSRQCGCTLIDDAEVLLIKSSSTIAADFSVGLTTTAVWSLLFSIRKMWAHSACHSCVKHMEQGNLMRQARIESRLVGERTQ